MGIFGCKCPLNAPPTLRSLSFRLFIYSVDMALLRDNAQLMQIVNEMTWIVLTSSDER